MAKLINGKTEYALTKSSARGGAMPKRGDTLEVTLDGNPVEAKVTSNAAWCGDPSLTLEYIWLPINGRALYVTLGYGEKASSWAGAELEVASGNGPKVPTRLVAGSYKEVTVELEREAGRINAFRSTWSGR